MPTITSTGRPPGAGRQQRFPALVAFALAALLVTPATLAASISPAAARGAVASPTTNRASGPVESVWENPSRAISGDDGLSVALPNGNALWVFGDTGVFHANSSGRMVMTNFITGSTAAEGPYRAGQIPSSLDEIPIAGSPLKLSHSNPPAMYLPPPTDLYLPDGSGNRCTFASGQYPARWASGAALIPSTNDVLITYGEVCITGFGNIRAEGWGFLEYNWKTNAIDVGPDDVFPPARSGAALPPHLILGSPVISNGHVSLFSFVCTSLYVSCNAGHVYAATLPDTTSALQNQSSYQVKQATTDVSTRWQPMGIAVNSYPDAPLRMVETNAITGAYDVLTAKTATGPWHLDTTGIVPNCLNVLSGFCRALVGQPELSTPSQLVITYYNPAAGPMGTSGPIGHLVGVGTTH